MHSFWLSRQHGVILLRGHLFSDRCVRYILRLDDLSRSETSGRVYEVPPRLLSWQQAQLRQVCLPSRTQFGRLSDSRRCL